MEHVPLNEMEYDDIVDDDQDSSEGKSVNVYTCILTLTTISVLSMETKGFFQFEIILTLTLLHKICSMCGFPLSNIWHVFSPKKHLMNN